MSRTLISCALVSALAGGCGVASAGAAVVPLATPTPSPTPTATPPPTIGRVTVATKTSRAIATLPVTADLITHREIVETPGRTIESSLAAIPGFSQAGTDSRFINPHGGSVSMGGVGGGTGAPKAVITLDGVPVTNPNGSWVDWSRVPKLLVDRIEAVHGASSTLYGSQALGGVIAIETRRPTGNQFATDTFAGNLGTVGSALAVGRRFSDHAAVSLYVDDQKSDGYRAAVVPNPTQPTSRYNGQRTFVVAYLGDGRRNDLEVGAATQVDHREGDPSGPSFYVGRSTFARYRSTREHGQQLGASFSVDQTDYAFDRVNNANVEQGHNRLGWSTLLATAQETFGGPSSRVTTGVDARLTSGYRDALGTRYVEQTRYTGLQRAVGAFAEADAARGRWETVAGVRYDTYFQGPAQTQTIVPKASTSPYPNAAPHHVSPRIAERYTLTPGLSLRASYANAFSAPNWSSIYGGYYGAGGIFYSGNPAIKPETEDRYEAGVEAQPDSASRLYVTAYHARLQQRIVFTQVTKTLYQRVNLGDAETGGYELGYQRQLSPVWSFRGAYANARGVILSSPNKAAVGKVIPQDPFQVASAQLRFDNGRRAFSVGARYVGTQYGDDTNTQVFGNAFLVDASAQIAIGHGLFAYAEGQNLNNRRYLADSMTYGAPSTFVIGIRRSFR